MSRALRNEMSPDEMLRYFKPAPYVLEIADLIELRMGNGGASFPGAADLYAAAEKIQAWALLSRDAPAS